VADTLAAILRHRSHEVTVASSGEEALRCDPCDVLVTDVGLAGMSGLDVLEELLLRGEAPRTLVMSGQENADNCARALTLGAVDFLPKPVNIDHLVRLVEQDEDREIRSSCTFGRRYRVSRELCECGPRDLLAFTLRSGVGPAARARIASALAEVLENVWRHAYPTGDGEVEVRAQLTPSELSVSVRDEGVGMDTASVARTPVRKGSPCGFARVSALSEDLVIRSGPGTGTQVEMLFTIFSARFDNSQQTDLSDIDWLSPQLARTVMKHLENPDHEQAFQFSPALAVSIGRLLNGPRPIKTPRTRSAR